MDRLSKNSQLERERATYRYLSALDTGDIDDIITTLQQATYDASLEQMVLEAHQAYFQEEGVEKALLENTETIEAPALRVTSLPAAQNKKPFSRKRRSARWIQVLAALLIIGALIGSFLALFGIYRSNVSSPSKTATPQSSVCQPYPLKQFDISIQETSDSLNRLEGMTTISENDAWAVGYSFNAPLVPQDMRAFTTHWDGKSWRVVPSANKNGKKTALEAVAAVSANDVWAVGYSYASLGATEQSDQTLIEHWDGKTWQIVNSPNSPDNNGILNSMGTISQNDIWAAGFFVDNDQTMHPLLEHWNGNSWQVVSPPLDNAPVSGAFWSIAANSASDVWVIGSGTNQPDVAASALVAHWDGKTWKYNHEPQSVRGFLKIAVVSSHELWAITTEGGLLHWDGQQWKSVTLPKVDQAGKIGVTGIVTISTGELWVTEVINKDDQSSIAVFRGDGKTWRQVAVPALKLPPSLTRIILSDIISYSGHQIWIAGFANDSEGVYSSSFILGQRTCP